MVMKTGDSRAGEKERRMRAYGEGGRESRVVALGRQQEREEGGRIERKWE